MTKSNLLPKKGQKVFAEYVISGKVQKQLELGIVVKATKDYFYCKDNAGITHKRSYSYGVSNGVRLKCFRD